MYTRSTVENLRKLDLQATSAGYGGEMSLLCIAGYAVHGYGMVNSGVRMLDAPGVPFTNSTGMTSPISSAGTSNFTLGRWGLGFRPSMSYINPELVLGVFPFQAGAWYGMEATLKF